MIASDGTKLTTAIDIALDVATADVEFRTLHVTQVVPVDIRIVNHVAIQFFATSHTTGIDVTATSVVQTMCVRGRFATCAGSRLVICTWNIVCAFPCRQVADSSRHVLILKIVANGAAADVDFYVAASLREPSIGCRRAVIFLVVIAHFTITFLIVLIESITH